MQSQIWIAVEPMHHSSCDSRFQMTFCKLHLYFTYQGTARSLILTISTLSDIKKDVMNHVKDLQGRRSKRSSSMYFLNKQNKLARAVMRKALVIEAWDEIEDYAQLYVRTYSLNQKKIERILSRFLKLWGIEQSPTFSWQNEDIFLSVTSEQ